MIKNLDLKPIKETTEDYEILERKIRALFRREIYIPLMKELGESNEALTNAASRFGVYSAISSGRVQFNRGVFSGKFNATISKELRSLGARFDRSTGTYKIPLSELPYDLRSAISASESKFKQRLRTIDQKLAKILPEEIADRLKVEHIFDRSLWKVDKEFHKTIKGITVAPQLTDKGRKILAKEWTNNMKKYVQDFSKDEIKSLRADMQKTIFAGNRYESAVKTIQKSYGVSERKAKFLARQETGLLMAKFKQVRYQDAGVEWYKWGCVSGTKDHPVRPWHRSLEGKKFRWDDPPVTTEPGTPTRRNNPGEDYNCRCFARPIVSFKGEKK